MMTEILSAIAIAGMLRAQASSQPAPRLELVTTLRQDARDPPAAQEVGPEKDASGFVWDERPSFRFHDDIRIDVRARFQADVRRSYDGADVRAGLRTFELPRRRVGIEGELFNHIEFEVEREVNARELTAVELVEGLNQKTPWKDVYVDLDYVERAQIQAGRFKIPFGRDELTGIASNDFVYRSLGADYLAPGRDTGVMAHGRFFRRGLNYWGGIFRHDGDNARSKRIQGGNQTVAIRLTGTPFRPLGAALSNVELGVALTEGAVSADSFRPNGLRGRTVVTEDTVLSSVYVSGRRRRWEGDLEWLWGPGSVRAEYTRVSDDRLGQGVNGQDPSDARYGSWYAAVTYLLTGETKTRPVRPRAELFRGGIGAVEVAARYERIWYDSAGAEDVASRNPRAETIMPSGDRVLTLGVNWILNRWITLQANAIRERVEDLQRSPVPDGAAFWSRVLRIQFVL
ncbi:MAG TPA: porin [Vicinamibacterales bacterium]|nr:porin [Vicinamibacterales bacterium]